MNLIYHNCSKHVDCQGLIEIPMIHQLTLEEIEVKVAVSHVGS